jgi:FMN-dependent NADH-azoreductase
LTVSDGAIAQVLAAHALVIGVPIYNLFLPSVLKAWIDHVARAGRTFRYTPGGPQGLVTGKRVYLAITSGGIYTDGPRKPLDFAEPYLKATLGFLGMTDVTTYRAEGLALPGVQDTALQNAMEAVRR